MAGAEGQVMVRRVLRRHWRTVALVVAMLVAGASWIRRAGDFAGYVTVGRLVLSGGHIYADAGAGLNTWPPFFSLVCVPLALLAAPSPYLARGCWILLNFGLLLLVLRILARLVYGRDMSLRATSGDLHPTSPELLVPLILSSRYVLGNFEHQQVNILTFALALGGLYLHSNRRELLGGVCLGAAAALKVMAVLFIPYLVYRRQWRTALSAAATTAALSLSPILVFGPTRFWDYVAAWRAAVEVGWGVGKMNQSVFAMLDRWIGHGMVPFSVTGASGIPASGDPRVMVGVALLAAIVALLCLVTFRDGGRRGSWPDLAEWSVVFICSAIFGPVSWKAYLVVLLLPNTLLFAAWRSSELTASTRRGAGLVLLTAFALGGLTNPGLIGKAAAGRLEMTSVVTLAALVLCAGSLRFRATFVTRSERPDGAS